MEGGTSEAYKMYGMALQCHPASTSEVVPGSGRTSFAWPEPTSEKKPRLGTPKSSAI